MSMWSRCQHCMWGLLDGRMKVWGLGEEGEGGEEGEENEEGEFIKNNGISPSTLLSPKKRPRVGAVDLSASNWGEFFHCSGCPAGGHDRLQGDYSAAPPHIETRDRWVYGH